jgi:hypothetical protein
VTKEWFTTKELLIHSGLSSKHMVDYLCRTQILSPSLSKARRRGVARQFAYADILVARSISALLRSGVSVDGLRGVLRTLRNKLGTGPVRALSKSHVIIIGKRVYLRESGQAIVDLTAEGQLAFHFILDTSDMEAGAPAPSNSNLHSRPKRRAA